MYLYPRAGSSYASIISCTKKSVTIGLICAVGFVRITSLVPRPNPLAGKRVWCTSSDFLSWASRMQNSHVILIIVMATHCLVCGSRMQQHCGLICATGAQSHEKSHAVNQIGAPEIGTATSSSPRNRSKYCALQNACQRCAVGKRWTTLTVVGVNNVPLAPPTLSIKIKRMRVIQTSLTVE